MKISYSPAQSVDVELIYTFCKDLIAAYETDSIDMEKVLPWCRRKIETSLSEYHRILKDGETAGYIHICIKVDSKEKFEEILAKVKAANYEILYEPATVGGTEFRAICFEDNIIEVCY